MIHHSLSCNVCGAENSAQATQCRVCGKALRGEMPQGSLANAAPALVEDNMFDRLQGQQGRPSQLLKQQYRVLNFVGRGGFGIVYRAEDSRLGNRAVAIKEMSQKRLAPHEIPAAAEAFQREAMLLATLMHPNLPRIYEQFSENGRWYLVMDFIDGETLEQYMRHFSNQVLPLKQTLFIAVQLCSVLDYLHQRRPPIIFRDLKPSNIMLNREGHVYLIDFGIARHFKRGQDHDTKAMGSHGYAAPEQFGHAQTTPRADIYSLGVTLYQMLTGDDPMRVYLQGPVKLDRLSRHPSPVLQQFAALVRQMLAVDVEKRPESMMIVKRELQRVIQMFQQDQSRSRQAFLPPDQHSPVSQRFTGRLQPIHTGPLDPKAFLGPPPLKGSSSLSGVAVNMASSTPVPNPSLSWSRDSQMLQPTPLQGPGSLQPFQEMAGRSVLMSQYMGHNSSITSISWSSSGLRVASTGRDSTIQVWDALLSKKNFSIKTDSLPLSVSWSPDGQFMVSGDYEGIVQVWHTGSDRKFFQSRKHSAFSGHTGAVNAVSWSPDGRFIASGGDDRSIYIWSFGVPSNTRPYAGHQGRVRGVAWSPDSSLVASASEDRTVHVWAVGNQMHSDAVRAVAWSPDGGLIASASADGTVQVWDALTGRTLHVYRGHTAAVNTLVWSADSQRIISGSEDTTVHIVDVVSGLALVKYEEHSASVRALACSPERDLIVSGGAQQDDNSFSIHSWVSV